MIRITIRTVALAALGGLALSWAGPAAAQMSGSDLVIRLDQLEHQMRQLTGTIEQLQYRNQQLEQALRRMQEDNEFRFQQLGGRGAPTSAPGRPAGSMPANPGSMPANPGSMPANAPPPLQSSAPVAPLPPPSAPGRRSDAFDPGQNPGAPGAPRTLGSMPGNMPPNDAGGVVAGEPVIGAPAGRTAGAPLDLSTLAGGANNPPMNPSTSDGQLPPPPARNPNATGGQIAAVLPPSQTPRDEYDLAYGYLLRKDYALSEDGFRTFLRKYPSDRQAADAQFWLGESMFQRQSYRDAADAFLTVTKKYETSAKAPDALLRLAQSLAAMGQKELACATFVEIGNKYPRATLNVKQSVEREQKRVHC
jgi:tol-pal system protein YbgF